MSIPDICDIGLADGLADGIGIFICSGDALGVGDAAGICIPGMFICICGEAEGVGDACGICIPGIIFAGVGDGDAFGVAGVGEGIGIL